MSSENCLFCKIVTGSSPAKICFQDDDLMVFHDIKPVAKNHVLVVPKQHFDSVNILNAANIPLVDKMVDCGKNVLKELGGDMSDIRFGFHNPPFNSIKHLHLHCISPTKDMTFLHNLMFRPNTWWFSTTSNKAASDHFGINESNVRRWKRMTARGEFLERRTVPTKKSSRRRKTAGKSRRRRKKCPLYQQENSSDLGYEVRKKWRNLKDSYARYLKSFSSNPAAKRCYQKWHWAKHLEFMRPYLSHMLDAATCEDSMPLQQRLTAIATPKHENPAPTLKSQPLSPTKLKVTRQSTSKTTVQEPPPEKTPHIEAPSEEVCLRWNSHHSNMQTAFPSLLSKEQYCDVTLVAEGKTLKCHKLILSSCSSYFDQVLEKIMPYQHPVIFMKDIPFNILKALCDFMYAGEVNILQGDLDHLLAVAESLKIKGLANKADSHLAPKSVVEPKETTPVAKPTRTTASRSSAVSEKKNSAKSGDVTDPLDLLQPTYEEEATPDPPPSPIKRNDQTRKPTVKRVRKRKHVEDEHEPSPPVFRTRKGTRSRPNVKVPRYFNASFDNSSDIPPTDSLELTQQPGREPCSEDPLMDIIDEIKTEPVDIEDGLISYGEESFDMPEETNVEYEAEAPAPTLSPRKAKTKLAPTVTTKQEKEDVAPDPLNVESSEERRKQIEHQTDGCNNVEDDVRSTMEERQESLVESSTLAEIEATVELGESTINDVGTTLEEENPTQIIPEFNLEKQTTKAEGTLDDFDNVASSTT